MAAPNIVNVTSILGKTHFDSDVSNVDAFQFSCPADKVCKISLAGVIG